MSADFDANQLREVEIKRLAEMAELAYKNATDEELKMRTRESWHQKYTNTVLALNQLLRDLQFKDYEQRLKVVEESATRRRTSSPLTETKRQIASIDQQPEGSTPAASKKAGSE